MKITDMSPPIVIIMKISHDHCNRSKSSDSGVVALVHVSKKQKHYFVPNIKQLKERFVRWAIFMIEITLVTS